MTSGILYIVATPIGNLKDITTRALETLKSVDYILCEDTRDSQNLLSPFGITNKTLSLHQHSPEKRFKEVLDLLGAGQNLALITDAGTPGISDPGSLLVEFILKHDPEAHIVPIPGASAVTAALSVSGFPVDKFYFGGFPPHKNKREKYFKELAKREETVVFYESPHRIKKCLVEIVKHFNPERQIVVCRELTKKFESFYRGKVLDLSNMNIPEKGEFVIIIKG